MEGSKIPAICRKSPLGVCDKVLGPRSIPHLDHITRIRERGALRGALLHQTRRAAATLEPTYKHAHRLLVLDPRHLILAYDVSPSGSRGEAVTCGESNGGMTS